MKDLKINNINNYLNDEFSKNESDKFECELENHEAQLVFKNMVVVNHLIDLNNNAFNHEAAFKSFENKISQPKIVNLNFKRKTYASIIKYAAIFVFAIFISKVVFNEVKSPDLVKVMVPAGDRSQIVLPDGTTVWLNSNSELRYASNFYDDDIRKVYLKGEAFFDVVKNVKKPFIVMLESDVKVKVLGTTFNIRAYPEDLNITTTLITGKIDLSYKENTNKSNIMYPKDKADFQKEKNKMVFEKIDNANDVVAWKDKRLVFKKESLRNIVNEINRFYDVDIIIANKNLESKVFTASFKKEIELTEILAFLSISGNFKCEKVTIKKWKII